MENEQSNACTVLTVIEGGVGGQHTELFPAWRQALKVLLERGLENGDVLKKSELIALFGLKQPVTAEQQERFQLDFLRQFGELRDELLEEYRIALRTMFGESSYEVVPPNDQTDLAMSEGDREIKRALRRQARTLAFVRHDELTDEERKKNADAQAKTAMLASMIRKPRLVHGK